MARFGSFIWTHIRLIRLSSEQKSLLLHAPNLLNSLLNIALAHSWLLPTMRIMHLHAHLTQAIVPGGEKMVQFPGIDDPSEDLPDSLEGLIDRLEETGDRRVEALRKAGQKWGKLEVVDACYKGVTIFTNTALLVNQRVY